MNIRPIPLSIVVLGIAMPALASAQALEQARVISSTPIVQQFSQPQQVCNIVQVMVPTPSSGAGAMAGAIIGGVIGNSLGHGAGNAAATALGVMGGAIIGDRAEGSQAQLQNMQQCTVQQVSQSVTAYQVVYEYAGKQYQLQMQRDPGPFVTVQLSPVGTAALTMAAPAPVYSTVYPAPVYNGYNGYNPYNGYGAYYGPAYSTYPVTLGLGYHGGRRGHWR